MREVIGLLLAAGLLLAPEAHGQADAEPPLLTCHLDVATSVVAPRDAVLVRARLCNVTREPIAVVTAQDGSTSGRRLPRITFAVDGVTVIRPTACGHMNPLRPVAVQILAPGECLDPSDPARGAEFMDREFTLSFACPGRHVIGLRYTTGAADDRAWHAADEDRHHLLRVPLLDVACATTIEVRDAPRDLPIALPQAVRLGESITAMRARLDASSPRPGVEIDGPGAAGATLLYRYGLPVVAVHYHRDTGHVWAVTHDLGSTSGVDFRGVTIHPAHRLPEIIETLGPADATNAATISWWLGDPALRLRSHDECRSVDELLLYSPALAPADHGLDPPLRRSIPASLRER